MTTSTSKPNKHAHLVISILSEDHTGVIEEITDVIHEAGCNLEDSRMSVLGDTFAMILLASGNWNTTTKLEKALLRLSQNTDLVISTRRAERRAPCKDSVPYDVDVVTLDQPGIVHELAHFFAARGVNIYNMITSTYAAPHTGSPMFSLHMTVEIPAQAHLASLRDEFLDLCDDLNLDGIMEPVKH